MPLPWLLGGHGGGSEAPVVNAQSVAARVLVKLYGCCVKPLLIRCRLSLKSYRQKTNKIPLCQVSAAKKWPPFAAEDYTCQIGTNCSSTLLKNIAVSAIFRVFGRPLGQPWYDVSVCLL